MTAKTQDNSHVYDLVSEVLRPGHVDDLRRVFLDAGAQPPVVIWAPERSDLRNSLLRQFHDKCNELSGEDGAFRASDLKLEDFGALADWLMLVERNAEGNFTYLYYGGAIADAYGQDMSGRTVEAFGGYISSFFSAVYAAAAERGAWIYTEHEPPVDVFVRSWHRLVIPLVGKDSAATRHLVMNVPENELSAGLELLVDPVFVITEDRKVAYHNEAARQLFRLPRKVERDKSLSDLTGIALNTRQTPSDMLKTRTREDSTELAVRGAIVERLVVTASAAQLRGKAYYVVIMRMLGA